MSFNQQLVDEFTFGKELLDANSEVLCANQGIAKFRCAIDKMGNVLEEGEEPLVKFGRRKERCQAYYLFFENLDLGSDWFGAVVGS